MRSAGAIAQVSSNYSLSLRSTYIDCIFVQAFPLHRRINGPGIQSSCSTGPSRMTPLQPSNPSTVTTTNHGGPLRRSLGFKSQIPIRIDFGDQQNLLRARVLERHRQYLLSTSQSSTAATLQAVRTSSSSSSSSSAGLQ